MVLYGPILWIALAAYIVFAIPRAGHYGSIRSALFGCSGLSRAWAYPSEMMRGAEATKFTRTPRLGVTVPFLAHKIFHRRLLPSITRDAGIEPGELETHL